MSMFQISFSFKIGTNQGIRFDGRIDRLDDVQHKVDARATHIYG